MARSRFRIRSGRLVQARVQAGRAGPAVIVGHVDPTSGPAVFYRLGRLTPGAQVRVSWRSGSSVSLRVYAVREYAKSAFPTARVYGLTRRPELRLVTCGPSMSRPTTTSTTWSSSHAAPGALGLSSTLGQTTVREPAKRIDVRRPGTTRRRSMRASQHIGKTTPKGAMIVCSVGTSSHLRGRGE